MERTPMSLKAIYVKRNMFNQHTFKKLSAWILKLVLHITHLPFSDSKILKIIFYFLSSYFRDCDEGTCRDKSNILYAWARNAPPTRLPKGISPLIWSSCVQGQGEKGGHGSKNLAYLGTSYNIFIMSS